ncbi:hypothetical protein Droror1_Dr00006522 [Drosera rotundifolia]
MYMKVVSRKGQTSSLASIFFSKVPISMEILINSSVCSMQRMVVLEDGELVELLLKPVKDNVLYDIIYLGVVGKRIPQMGGAFVYILEIKIIVSWKYTVWEALGRVRPRRILSLR